jgi:hypothetical protein
LSMWHQGLHLNPLNPSFAMVAYCGAIETIATSKALRAQTKVVSPACEQCGNVPRAHDRFWTTIGLVRSPEQVEALKEGANPYSRRSRTAHGSDMFGMETSFGSMHMMIYVPPSNGAPGTVRIDEEDESQVFMWHEVPQIRAVAADLLLYALNAG